MNSKLMKVVKWSGFIIAGVLVVYTVMLVASGTSLRKARARVAASGYPASAEQIIPAQIAARDNAAYNYQAAALTLKSGGDLWKSIEVKQLSGTNRGEIVKYMESEEVAAALDLVRKGTLKAGCRYDLDYSKGAELPLPHVSDLRAMARLIAVQIKLLTEKGDNEGAWKNVIAGYKLADALRTEPLLISQLVRAALYGIIDQGAIDLCKISPPNDAQCEAIADAVKPFADAGPFVRAIDGERILMSDWIFAQIESDPGKTLALISSDNSASTVNRLAVRVLVCKPYRQFMHASCLDVMLDMTKFMEATFYNVSASEGLRIADNVPRWNILGRMLTPVLVNVKAKLADVMAKAMLTGTTMSLMRHKLAHGSFPATLVECDAKFLPVQPVDPFSGKAPIYKLEGNGFALYSIGENMKDDGGRPEPSKEEKNKISSSDRDLKAWDLVWKLEGK